MAKATEKITDEKQARFDKNKYLNEKVECRIPRPEGIKEDFTTVTVNGKNYQIEYNKTVMVPRFIKAVIDNSDNATNEAQQKQIEFAKLFEAKAGNL